MLPYGGHEVHPLIGHVLGAQGVEKVRPDALSSFLVNM
jgi:hypothetical protein